MENLELQKIANTVRKDIVTAVHAAKSGHPGGSLSSADIMIYLYYEEMKNIDPENPDKSDRDRFVLSKGHCAPALYSVLAEKGFFPVEDLLTLRKIGSSLQGHPDKKKIFSGGEHRREIFPVMLRRDLRSLYDIPFADLVKKGFAVKCFRIGAGVHLAVHQVSERDHTDLHFPKQRSRQIAGRIRHDLKHARPPFFVSFEI